ncbi:hypothetical protein C3B44_08125 [Corynebacterium yudongzhengii]|uniref:exo-alpha-sialidase n=1 Tax=Corynebacterium yudongzhengii TaxID=2080740 RepID=A0A2U1T7S9_9CORY|nr:hypothetical protein C3B44_08125 [Corynebacterium yudongzhengii]PWC02057.1 exo-alpha-sialidase [Corynebacterium yudongzhengii]
MNFGLAVSHDNGHTWEQRIITNEVLGPLVEKHKIISCFATSGAGTQKKTEPHAGRLLQQAACITDTNGNGIPENNNDDVIALTLYSDDHGETWQAGNPTDPQGIAGERIRFDENKVAELSDGSLMLNSRTQAWHGAGHRIVAISRDGGVTWGDYRIDESLVDPANNAQLIRAFPNAAPGTLRSKVLLFSNTDTTGQRVNGTLHISYDDGATWAKKKTFREEGTGYTTMAIQEDGSIGILLEPAVANQIGYMNTTLRWLDPDLQTELKAKENTEVSVADDGTIETLQLVELFERNDPLLEDTFEVKGLPEGLDFDASAGTITGAISGSGRGPVEVTLTEADDGTGHPRTATATVVFEGGPEGADEIDAGLEGSAGGSSSSAGAGAGLVAALGLALGIGGLIHNPAVVQQARDFFAQFGIRI